MKRTDAALILGTVPARKPTVGKLRVLIAEERTLPAARLKVLLERLGHEVVKVADGGHEAVGSAFELEPDLIIMHSRLSPIGGAETARTILGQRAIPIIYRDAAGNEVSREKFPGAEPAGSAHTEP